MSKDSEKILLASLREMRAQLKVLKRARLQLEKEGRGLYDADLAKASSQVAAQITRASAELRQLEAHRHRVAKSLSPDEVEQLVMEYLADAGLDQRIRFRAYLDGLASSEGSVLA